MSDLFDYLSQQEIAPQMPVRPVLAPIFPLVVPERSPRLAAIVPVFSAPNSGNPDVPSNSPAHIPHRPPSEMKSTATVLPQPVIPPAMSGESSVLHRSGDERGEAESRPILGRADHAAEPVRQIESGTAQSEPVMPVITVVQRAAVIPPVLDVPLPVQAPSPLTVLPNLPPDTGALPGQPAVPVTVSPPPEIRINIGRIEVRAAELPRAPGKAPVTKNAPRLSLDDYLRSRSGGS